MALSESFASSLSSKGYSIVLADNVGGPDPKTPLFGGKLLPVGEWCILGFLSKPLTFKNAKGEEETRDVFYVVAAHEGESEDKAILAHLSAFHKEGWNTEGKRERGIGVLATNILTGADTSEWANTLLAHKVKVTEHRIMTKITLEKGVTPSYERDKNNSTFRQMVWDFVE